MTEATLQRFIAHLNPSNRFSSRCLSFSVSATVLKMSQANRYNDPAPGVSFYTPHQSPVAGTALDPQPNGKPIPKVFQPIKIRGLEFQNRIFVEWLRLSTLFLSGAHGLYRSLQCANIQLRMDMYHPGIWLIVRTFRQPALPLFLIIPLYSRRDNFSWSRSRSCRSHRCPPGGSYQS